MLHARVARQLAGRPVKSGVVTIAIRHSICLDFVHRLTIQVIDGPEAQAIIRACFSDVRVAPAASTFSRDVVTNARADVSTDVSAFSRDQCYISYGINFSYSFS